MKDTRKTKKQLISEVIELRQLAAALNTTETECRQSRAALQESEAMFRNLLDYIPGVSIQEYTTDGIVRYWNKASEEVYGYTAEEAIGRNLGDLIIPPEVQPLFKQALELGAKCTRSGELMHPSEVMLLHKNGSLVPVYSIHTVVCMSDKPPLMFCLDVDLSERKRTEETLRKAYDELERRVEERTAELAKVNDKLRREIEKRKLVEESLRESEEKYMTMIEYSNDMIWTLDKKGNFIYFNNKSEEITGYKIKEALNKEFMPTILEEDLEMVYDVFRRTLQGKPLHYEVRIHDSSRKKLITLSVNTAPIYKDKEIIGTVSFGRDITERKQAEAALHASQQWFRAIFETAEDSIFIKDRHLRYTHVNPAMERIFGVPASQLLEKSDKELFGDEAGAHIGEADSCVLRGEITNEEHTKPVAGVPTTFHVIKVPIRDNSGEIISLCGIARDITAQKVAIDELRLARINYRMIADYTYGWEWWKKPDGTFRYVSPACERITGYKPDRFIEKRSLLREIIVPEDREKWDEHNRQTNKDIGRREMQFRIKGPHGEIRWIEHFCQPVFTRENEFLGIRASNRDITERKQSEEVLRKSATQLQLATTAARIGHWDWDTRTSKMYFSPEWKRHLGYEDHELPNRLETWKSRLHPDDRRRVIKDIHDYLAGRLSDYAIEFRLKHKDGSYRWIYTRAEKLLDDTGNAYRFFGCHVDITDRKQTVLELKKSLAEIKRLKDLYEKESLYLREEIDLVHDYRNIIGNSHAIRHVLSQVEQIAGTDSNVLILGETGTGKELIARAVHHNSPWKDRPLIKTNCATLSAHLIESELFGHERGSFTGAIARRAGRFEIADGSSIFLDEIAELSIELQAKLLRVIEDGEFERIGSSKTMKVSVRIIAATNRDLEKDVRDGRFRRDLWYRLNVFPITLPPLRDRIEDIPLLVQYFLNIFTRKLGKNIVSIPAKVMTALQSYSWPGNVRELENVLERAIISTSGPNLSLSEKLGRNEQKTSESFKSLHDMERNYIVKVLEETDWKVSGKNSAAEILGLDRSTLRFRMKKMNIHKP
ncbi:MAG: PAS domain S-box protein [Desulfobacteraceae bacterium]|nr:PAS domain S-box protein [Desulfobacteraceae bacterium]MBC2755856.1 PAS domain S-box protein [Desulfobacteraceae bacterium]